MTARLSHLNEKGEARMVDVSPKEVTLTEVTIDFQPSRDPSGLRIEASAKVDAKTGVEMEALTAVSIACLTIYDMAKAADRGMTFSGIRLIEKTGGRSGPFKR